MTPAAVLFYRGRGCGGVNLPFPALAEAVAYASGASALAVRVELAGGPDRYYARPDCRRALRPIPADAPEALRPGA